VDNLEYYHGTGAFNMTLFPNWDSVLLKILTKPKTTVEVTRKSRRAGGGGGWRGEIGGWNAPKKEVQKNPNIKEVSGSKLHSDMDVKSLCSPLPHLFHSTRL
jgi:hypothetical protein